MKNLFPILALLTIFGLGSCGSSEPKNEATTANGEINYDAMAIELCDCMGPMMEFQGRLMAMLAEGNEEGVMAMQDEAMGIQQSGEACVQALEAKYGIIEGPEMEEKATEALRKACPEFMKMMEGEAEGGDLEDMSIEELERALKEAEEAVEQ